MCHQYLSRFGGSWLRSRPRLTGYFKKARSLYQTWNSYWEASISWRLVWDILDSSNTLNHEPVVSVNILNSCIWKITMMQPGKSSFSVSMWSFRTYFSSVWQFGLLLNFVLWVYNWHHFCSKWYVELYYDVLKFVLFYHINGLIF